MPDTILAIASFALALAVFVSTEKKRQWAVFILAVLVVATGAIAWRRVVYERSVRRTQAKIVEFVTPQAHSVDEMYEELRPIEPTIVDEALSRCVGDGTVEPRSLDLRTRDDKFIKVRAYYRP